MNINTIKNSTHFGALHFSKNAYSRLSKALQEMPQAEKTTAETKVVKMLQECFSDVKKDIYIHSFETKNNIHFQLSQSKNPIGAILEHNFVDFGPKMLKVEKNKTTTSQMVDAVVNFVRDIDKNRTHLILPIGFKR